MYSINVSYVLIYAIFYFISDSFLSNKPHDKPTTKVTIDAIVSVDFKLSSLPIIYVASPLAHINPMLEKIAIIPEALPYEEYST